MNINNDVSNLRRLRTTKKEAVSVFLVLIILSFFPLASHNQWKVTLWIIWLKPSNLTRQIHINILKICKPCVYRWKYTFYLSLSKTYNAKSKLSVRERTNINKFWKVSSKSDKIPKRLESTSYEILFVATMMVITKFDFSIEFCPVNTIVITTRTSNNYS